MVVDLCSHSSSSTVPELADDVINVCQKSNVNEGGGGGGGCCGGSGMDEVFVVELFSPINFSVKWLQGRDGDRTRHVPPPLHRHRLTVTVVSFTTTPVSLHLLTTSSLNGKPLVPVINEGMLPNFTQVGRLNHSVINGKLKIFSVTPNSELSRFWIELSLQARQELPRIDKQTLFEKAR
ncbi:hypothetical protein L1987_03614 [Smallanthus sonchifolius]|uniref:Uncharacterized protein n=1 Tax=Smallanthus sonchifolius TaxID=185202 RepID=A0ACB9KB59_9ASTR|nr:hypothetical protein L1987_03614 [Smallanthus sonchifolius]